MATTDRARECYGAQLFFLLFPIIVLNLFPLRLSLSASVRGGQEPLPWFSRSVEIAEAFWPA
jgi:hypothetical protein